MGLFSSIFGGGGSSSSSTNQTNVTVNPVTNVDIETENISDAITAANDTALAQQLEIESKKLTRYHNILEWLAMALLITGIITAALNVNLGGFTPLTWIVLALFIILLIICMEVSMIRAFLESRKKD